MTERRALIIGGTGQDGSLIAQQLIGEGIEVHATGRHISPLQSVPNWARIGVADMIKSHRLDSSDGATLTSLLASIAPSMIFCLAGQSSVGRSFAMPAQTIRSHVDPVVSLCGAVRDLGLDCHIVVAASGEIFGESSDDRPASEDSAFAPRNPYGVAKAMAVMAAKSFRDHSGQRLSIAYLYNHESPLRTTDFLFGKILAGIAAIRSGEIDHISLGNGTVARDWGWAPDYAAAMIQMAAQPDGIDLILATGQTMVLRKAVSSLVAEAGLDPDKVVRWQAAENIRSDEAQVMAANSNRARATIGWTGSVAFPKLAQRLLSSDMSPSCR